MEEYYFLIKLQAKVAALLKVALEVKLSVFFSNATIKCYQIYCKWFLIRTL